MNLEVRYIQIMSEVKERRAMWQVPPIPQGSPDKRCGVVCQTLLHDKFVQLYERIAHLINWVIKLHRQSRSASTLRRYCYVGVQWGLFPP